MKGGTIACQDCNEYITDDVNEALDEIYGGGRLSGLESKLRFLVQEPPPLVENDQELLLLAMTHWLGFDPVALVQAVRHHEIEEADDGRYEDWGAYRDAVEALSRHKEDANDAAHE